MEESQDEAMKIALPELLFLSIMSFLWTPEK
jgi:hypothetical protein